MKGLNLDDERTQAILCITRAFAKKYPRIDKCEKFTTWECLSIRAVLNKKQPEINSTKYEVRKYIPTSINLDVFSSYKFSSFPAIQIDVTICINLKTISIN